VVKVIANRYVRLSVLVIRFRCCHLSQTLGEVDFQFVALPPPIVSAVKSMIDLRRPFGNQSGVRCAFEVVSMLFASALPWW
jgi:hypothetical protein